MKARIVGLVAMCLVAMGCAGSKLTSQDDQNIATYTAQQSACVVAHQPDKAAIDTCRAQVRAAWDARFNTQFDGGFGG